MLKSVALALGLVIVAASVGPAQSRERLRWRMIDPQLDVYMAPEMQPRLPRQPDMRLVIDRSQVNIAPSEAAAIARDMVPGAKVVGVKLLPSGYYAVTLRGKGSVTRVMVSAIDGSVR